MTSNAPHAAASAVSLPLLRPVRIPTSGLPWHQAIKVWWSTQRTWEVCEDYWIRLQDGTRVVIPRGFVFNGATVPRPLRWFVSPTGVFLIPSLLHDFAYTYNFQLHAVGDPDDGDKRQAFPTRGSSKDYRDMWDLQFYRLGKQVTGMGWLSRTLYVALRLFGGRAWKESRRKTPPPV